MEETKSITLLNNATKMLAEVQTIDDAKNLMDLAALAKLYAKKHKLGNEAVNYAHGIQFEAEIKLGEILTQTEKNKGVELNGKDKNNLSAIIHDDSRPTLSELGISLNLSSESQALALLPEEEKEKVRKGKTSKKNAISKNKNKEKQENKKYEIKELPTDIFEIIYCDPPWKYDFAETDNRKIENQYPTMGIDEICNMELPKITKDALLLMWATTPKLKEALKVIDAWGFTYKSHCIWDKEKIGMGYWFRGQHELLLVATKGKYSPPEPENRISSVYKEKRGGHSVKPTFFYNWIQKTFPNTKKIELFSRNKFDESWEVWGNE